MTTDKEEDGGYYAIKGFEYQIDKAIYEILNTKNENTPINIEHIQDIDSENFVMQVKYKEKAKFTPFIIKAPVIQLIEEFTKNPHKKYYLYAFFADLNGYEKFSNDNKQISIADLDSILGKGSSFTLSDKKAFVDNFYLDFSEEYEKQLNGVFEKIKELKSFGKTDDEIIFYYANISDFLRKLIINHKKENSQKRSCTKKEIIEYLKAKKGIIFNSSFRMYEGEQSYFEFIKNKFFIYQNIDDFERFIIIELSENDNISDIKNAVLNIKRKYYKEYGKTIKSGAPYFHFRNSSKEKIKSLKASLLADGNILKDGYDFYESDFSSEILKLPSTKENKVSLKFLDSEENLKAIIKMNSNKTKEIYQFFISDKMEVEEDIKHVQIQIGNLSDISSIIGN